MIVPMIELNKNYSTTRRVQKMDTDLVIAEINAAEQSEDKFETVLSLPEGEGRQGEGGLRTEGYFKKNEENKPLITVVTVVFNGEQFLEETILSVINQIYDNVEYIIIDGGSTDGTLGIIRKYEHAIDYWVSEKDRGIYDAMNKGCYLAFGNGINFLNAGDYFVGNPLSSKLPLPCILPCKLKKNNKLKDYKLKSAKYGMPISHQAIIFKNLYLYDLRFSLASDYDYFLKNIQTKKINEIDTDGYVVYDNSGLSYKTYLIRDQETGSIVRKNFGFPFFIIFKIKSFFKSLVKWLIFK